MKVVNVEYLKDAQWLAREAVFMNKKCHEITGEILWNDAIKLLKKAYGYESDEG